MLTYSISVYSWPTSLLKDLEKSIGKFILSGDSDKRKFVSTVSDYILKNHDADALSWNQNFVSGKTFWIYESN